MSEFEDVRKKTHWAKDENGTLVPAPKPGDRTPRKNQGNTMTDVTIKVVKSDQAKPLTEEQKAKAAPVLNNFQGLCLMSGKYKGEGVALICTSQGEEDNEAGPVILSPVLIVITDDMAKDLQNADGEFLVEVVAEIKERLEYLRGELRAERISYEELAELSSLAEHIDPGDVELLEAAGVPEFEDEEEDTDA
jgi:hypothetical protein